MSRLRNAASILAAGVVAAVLVAGGEYAYPRIMIRLFPAPTQAEPPPPEPIKVVVEQPCATDRVFRLSGPDTVVRNALTRMVIPQDFAPIEDFSTLVEVPSSGVLDVTFKLETEHRGDGYSEVIGSGAFITYQYAERLDQLDAAPIVHPAGWTGGTNIRDLRDHYGQINIVGALGVEPGFYRFCVVASAHSYLHLEDNLASVLVETRLGPLNAFRLSYKPGGELLD